MRGKLYNALTFLSKVAAGITVFAEAGKKVMDLFED